MARAPGRLDVMGGIADYSGSLVLQVLYLSLFLSQYLFILLGLEGSSLSLLSIWEHSEPLCSMLINATSTVPKLLGTSVVPPLWV